MISEEDQNQDNDIYTVSDDEDNGDKNSNSEVVSDNNQDDHQMRQLTHQQTDDAQQISRDRSTQNNTVVSGAKLGDKMLFCIDDEYFPNVGRETADNVKYEDRSKQTIRKMEIEGQTYRITHAIRGFSGTNCPDSDRLRR